MKARIKATNEIVDVYFDNFYGLWAVKGNPEVKYAPNALELLEEKDIDWEERRYEIVKQIMDSQLSCCGYERSMIEPAVKFSVECADALITELKKGGEK